MPSKNEKLKLGTMLGNYPNVAALKSGQVKSDLVEFDFADVPVANKFFKSVVREQKFDLSELAIATFLQAKSYGKPYTLLPITILGRGQLHTIGYNPERGQIKPTDLNGRRVGVRAYTQTTGVWVRGIFGDQYGMDFQKVKWVTFEDPHLAEYRDPPFIQRAPAGKELAKMLLDGEIDAAILGDKFPDLRLKPLIPDPEAANRAWAESHGGIPINHMLVIRDSIAKSRPDIVKEIFRLFREARKADKSSDGGGLDPYRFGIEPNRRSLELIIDYAFRQKLIPRKFTVDELFDDTMRALA
jgi:4,5-dihydroxyphthalate decarboxylase